MQQEMEELFRAMLPGRSGVDPNHSGLWRPAVEVYETEQALVVHVEIAGIDQNHLRISLDGDRLLIRGVRHDRGQSEKRSYHEARIPYGAFGADVFVPFPIDADGIEADYNEGFLSMKLPRLQARAIVPRSVNVSSGEGVENS
jgi:HSP20 family molecular chaperone IbpA